MAARLETFARRQLADVDGLIGLMMARIIEQLPMQHDLSVELKSEMSQWVRRITTSGLQIVADGGSLDELGPMIEQMANRRRAQGIELGQTLKAYEVMQQALLDSLTTQLRGHALEAALYPQLTRRLLEFQRVTTRWVTAGYADGPDARGPDRQSDLQALLEVRAGRRPAAPDDHDLGRRIGVSQPLREVTVSRVLGPDVADTVRVVARLNLWGVVGSLDGRVVALTLRAAYGFPNPSGTTRLPEPAEPAAVEAAIIAAGKAADVAAVLGHDRLTGIQAAPLAALLAVPEPDRVAFVEDCFGPLTRTARGRALLNSVSAMLTYSKAAEAAGALHIHRHTLDYRLGRFGVETGLDLNDPATRFRCSIALFLLGLLPHRPDQPDHHPDRPAHPHRPDLEDRGPAGPSAPSS